MCSFIAYLHKIIDETDDAFCEELIAEYEADKEKSNFISIDEMSKISVVNLM